MQWAGSLYVCVCVCACARGVRLVGSMSRGPLGTGGPGEVCEGPLALLSLLPVTDGRVEVRNMG